jgi:hypothetical protein
MDKVKGAIMFGPFFAFQPGAISMARNVAQNVSIDRILRDTADEVVARVSSAISETVGRLVEERLKKELAGGRAAAPVRGARAGAGRSTRARRRVDITRWTADARARRVPKFVIESTGLDTKKKIVAKFGENVTFEKGKPLPKTRAS